MTSGRSLLGIEGRPSYQDICHVEEDASVALYFRAGGADDSGMNQRKTSGETASPQVATSRRLVRACALSLWVAAAGCDRLPPPAAVPLANEGLAPEIEWTRAALSRNPDLEVLATDSVAGVFTVRIKSTSEVRTVRIAELAAAPISQLISQAQPAATSIEAEPMAPQAETRTTEVKAATPEPAPASPAPPAVDANPSATAATASDTATAYTIDRADGKVKVSGPGVSIVSSGGKAATTAAASETANTEPVICEGRRMLHLDNRTITARGDAIIARGGCELYITNSRIVATGTAVIVNDAVVHIANSTIEGTAASVDADDRARLLVRSSTFKGMQRRSEHASIQDQGGNQWR